MKFFSIARITGIGYFIIFLTGFYANFHILENLVIQDNSVATTEAIFNQIDQYTRGLISFIIMIVVDILLAAPLYSLLKNTHEKWALFSSTLRVVNGTIFAVALYSLFEIKQWYIFSNGEAQQVAQEVFFAFQMFQNMWCIALLFFGIHLLLLGYLFIRSTHFPALLGGLIMLAGVSYSIDCFAQIGFSQYAHYKTIFENMVVVPAVIGEFSLTLFLLIKNPKVGSKRVAAHR